MFFHKSKQRVLGMNVTLPSNQHILKVFKTMTNIWKQQTNVVQHCFCFSKQLNQLTFIWRLYTAEWMQACINFRGQINNNLTVKYTITSILFWTWWFNNFLGIFFHTVRTRKQWNRKTTLNQYLSEFDVVIQNQ